MTPAAPDPVLMARMAQHKTLGSAPVGEHAWLVTHGNLHTFAAGEVLTRKGELAEGLAIFLTGNVAIHIDRGAGSHKAFEWHGGDVGGNLPYSRGARPPGDAVTSAPTEILILPNDCLPDMPRECPAITTILVHAMVDRARQFNAADLRDEKLLSLGRLAAGLAHELNNPASAAARSARLLVDGLEAAEVAAATVGAAQLSGAQLAAVDQVRGLCTLAPVTGRSAMTRADREDAIAAWLREHGANEACAEPLAETAITLEALDRLAAQFSGPALDASIRWISAACQLRALAMEIRLATSRISELVNSVKGFTFMDRALSPEAIDIRRGISDTLTMLAGKIRAKGADVTTHFADGLPRARAVGAELNQVWMNLIDNALDAIAAGGRVTIDADRMNDRVVVRITDTGAGIPPQVLGRIFDPFFTTKDVGQGSGLGLDIVRRILRAAGGEVEVDSRPGHTEFRVILPTER